MLRIRISHQGRIAKPAILRRQAMNLAAVRAEQADRELLDVGQAFLIGIDAADDVSTGRGTGKNQRTHGTAHH